MLKLDSPLARMKAIASGLFLLAAALYVAALMLIHSHPVLGVHESLLRGCDGWRYRRLVCRYCPVPTPLGIAYSSHGHHPAQQGAYWRQLGDFICTHFLSREQVLQKVSEFDTARRLAQWLSKEDNAAVLSGLAVKLAGHGIGALRDERVRQFVRSTALARLEEVDLAKMSGQLLEVLTDDGRAQEVLDAVLNQVDISLQGEATKKRIADVLAAEFDFLRFNVFGKELPCTTLLATGHPPDWSSVSPT